MKKLACLLVLVASGCPDIKLDANETAGPVVEFDPAKSQATGARFLPFPNDLVRDPMTGKLNLGPQACESTTAKGIRETILNKLDGFGTYEAAMQVTFTAEVDESTLTGNVVLYQMTNGGTAVDPASAMPVPVLVRKSTTLRQLPDACTTPDTVQAITIIPMVPLKQKSTYVAAVLKGVKDTAGNDFSGSFTWGLVGAKNDPVTLDAAGVVTVNHTPLDPGDPAQLAQIQALDTLWKAHHAALTFLDAVPSARPRSDVLVGWQFTTQTVTDPLDPTVAGSPASKLGTQSFLVTPASVTGKFQAFGTGICAQNGETDATQCFLKLALGGCDPLGVGCGAPAPNNPFFVKGATVCLAQVYNCAAIGDVLGTAIGQVNYQTQLDNPFSATAKLQGPWSDPVNPETQGSLILETLITVPTGAVPANGWPVIIYGHGLTLSKETALTFAGRAAAAGFAVVAIDFSGHGSRAVRTSADVNLGCTGRCTDNAGAFTTPTQTCETIADCTGGGNPVTGPHCGQDAFVSGTGSTVGAAPTPTAAGQCYDTFLSTDLAKTRDGIRQTILDLERTVLAVKSCAAGCGSFKVDPTKILYAGVSLGGIFGSMATAESPDIKASLLSVPGAGWLDLLENTQTDAFRCPLVNSLIDAGIITGTKWTGANADATCVQPPATWQSQPGYATFAATGRWVLDPADPANYAAKLATKRFMIQEVIGDTVVPNISTERLAALSGVAPKVAAADPFNPLAPAPSAAVVTPTPMENKFLQYTSDANDLFVHSSLIRPATSGNPSVFGFLRMQIDAATFLGANK